MVIVLFVYFRCNASCLGETKSYQGLVLGLFRRTFPLQACARGAGLSGLEQEPAATCRKTRPRDCPFTMYSCDAHVWGCHYHQKIALASLGLAVSRDFQYLKCIGRLQAVIYNKVSYCSSLCSSLCCIFPPEDG